MRAVAALAVADLRERTRRPSYLVALAAAVVLGYLALPPADSMWVIVDLGGYRGRYDSAYVGTATALAGGLWLMLGGFYVVRGAVARDQRTGVGELLAASPLGRVGYLLGKFGGSLLVLASMAGTLAVTGLVLQVARGESRTLDPLALLTPYLWLSLPVLAMAAAAAVLFDTVPGLRTGLGNLVWFFVWMIAAVAGGGAPLGGLGPVRASMREAVAAQHSSPAGEWSLGFTQVDQPLASFEWDGWEVAGGFALGRLTLILVAVGLAAVPAIWFDRFDPARAFPRAAPVAVTGGEQPATPEAGHLPRSLATPTPLSPVKRVLRPTTGRLVVGELRILVIGLAGWWWLVVVAVNVAALIAPSPAPVLAAAWIWPILVWSRLGTQHRENGLETLLGSCPSGHRRLVAQWVAGVALTAVTGCGPLLRMVVTGDGPGVAAWAAGAMFIPSLALALGTVSRTHRTFQVAYLILWYAAVNQVAAVDYLGVVLVDGRPAGPPSEVIGGASLAMLATALMVRVARHALR